MDSVMGQVSLPFMLFNFMRGTALCGGARIFAARFGSMLGCFIAVTLISAPADAEDFRTLNLGSPCDAVPAREQARGSVAIPWKKIPGANVYAFTGRDYDRDLVVMYFCPQGTLFSGNYFFPIEQPENAVTSYRGVYDLLVAVYGAPFVDNTPWQVGGSTKDERVINPDPRMYMTAWRTPRLNVNMCFVQGNESEGPGWRVFVVISRRKD
jgi:hypothetical protein